MSKSKKIMLPHGVKASTVVLWVNLGSPRAPKGFSVARYLREFLSDPRVVELPRWLWFWILNGVIVPFRSRLSARKYRLIWGEGNVSPLVKTSLAQGTALQAEMRGRQQDIEVVTAMRYGQPSIKSVLDKIKTPISRLLVLPAYPQYSATTTASVFDEVSSLLQQKRDIPEFRFVKHYHDHSAYIDALAQQVRMFWEEQGRGEKLLLSFHGIPRANLDKGDPYFCECHKTARLLSQELALGESEVVVTFQSRLGRSQWLAPYTHDVLGQLAQSGVKKVDVFAPGFVADCLETLEELAITEKRFFLESGGEQFNYIPALNTHQHWIRALGDIMEMHLAGWPTFKSESIEVQQVAQRKMTLALAEKMGAVSEKLN